MIWLRVKDARGIVEPYFIRSKCARYQVSRVTVADRTCYECWKLVKPPLKLGSKTSADETDREKLKALHEAEAFADLDLAKGKAK